MIATLLRISEEQSYQLWESDQQAPQSELSSKDRWCFFQWHESLIHDIWDLGGDGSHTSVSKGLKVEMNHTNRLSERFIFNWQRQLTYIISDIFSNKFHEKSLLREKLCKNNLEDAQDIYRAEKIIIPKILMTFS